MILVDVAYANVASGIEKTEIPFGYGFIHASKINNLKLIKLRQPFDQKHSIANFFSCIRVRMTGNTHTSPVIEVHTWKKSASQRTTNEATMSQRVAFRIK